MPRFHNSIVVVAFLFLAASFNFAEAQKAKSSEAPKPVLAAFQKAFPNATLKSVSKERRDGKTVYEFESVDGMIKRDIIYDASGAVMEMEESIGFAQLSQPVQDAIKKDHPTMTVASCERLTAGDLVQFEVVLRQGKKSLDVVYDANGNTVKK